MVEKKVKLKSRSVAQQAIQPPRQRTNRTAITAGLVALGIAAVLTLALTLGPSNASLTASAKPAHGEILFRQYCVACHGAKGIGEFNWQNRERAAPALDSSGHAWHHEDTQLLSMILDKPVPDSRMPGWRGILSNEDALDLLAYIKSLWTPHIRDNCQGARHMECMRMR